MLFFLTEVLFTSFFLQNAKWYCRTHNSFKMELSFFSLDFLTTDWLMNNTVSNHIHIYKIFSLDNKIIINFGNFLGEIFLLLVHLIFWISLWNTLIGHSHNNFFISYNYVSISLYVCIQIKISIYSVTCYYKGIH